MARLLRGDLEWITMKALEKDRTRRYASASEFAADIGRHLASEPVLAGAPDLGYRIRKFVRRNKGLVAAGSAVAAALLIGAVVSFALYLKASREQEIAEGESYSANLSAAEMQLRAGQISEARSRLAGVPSALRGWEWRYLMTRTDESAATLYNRDAREMAISEDGSKIFSYGTAALRSWDISTKRLILDATGAGRVLAIGGHGRTALIATPPDGDVDPLPGGHLLRLYDVAAGRFVSSFQATAGNPSRATISNDGRFMAASTAATTGTGSSIAVWDIASAKILVKWEGLAPSANLRFSPDGELLASASLDQTVGIWDVTHRIRRATLKPGGFAMTVAFSNDGRLLASGTADGKAEIWDSRSGTSVLRWQASPSSQIEAVAFSPDSTMLATCSGEGIQVWEVATGRLRSAFNGHQGVWEVVFHPTAPKLYTSGWGVIKEWDLSRTLTVTDEAGPSKLALSPDGRYFAGSSRGRVGLYDATTAQLIRSWTVGTDEDSIAIVFSPDSLLIASGSGSTGKLINLWSVTDGRLVRTLSGYTTPPSSIAFSPDGTRVAAGSSDQKIRIRILRLPLHRL